jgi:phosphatidylglycerophosphate synthase
MFDIWLRRRIDPALDRIAAAAVNAGLSANMLTIAGAVLGLGAAWAVSDGQFGAGITLIGANRLCDGLDGAVARRTAPTAWGGYLDSIADYVFYVAVPIGFAYADADNLWPILLLVSSYVLTAVSFLALAAILSGRDMGHGQKSFTYTSGLIEGGETIAAYVAMCLLPQHVAVIATSLAVLCVITVLQRLWFARRILA